MVSFGSGAGSDAFSITVTDLILEKRERAPKTQDYIARRTEIDYATYVRYRASWRSNNTVSGDAVAMSEIVIAGIGQTDVGEHYSISLRELAYMALKSAIQDAGGLRPDILFVGNMVAPAASRQAHLGALISDYGGLGGIDASTIEAGGAAGGAALRMGYLAVNRDMPGWHSSWGWRR